MGKIFTVLIRLLYFGLFALQSNPALIEEDSATMEKVGIVEEQSILIEIRNKDLSWPEEMSLLAKNKQDKYKQGDHPGLFYETTKLTQLIIIVNLYLRNVCYQLLPSPPLTLTHPWERL